MYIVMDAASMVLYVYSDGCCFHAPVCTVIDAAFMLRYVHSNRCCFHAPVVMDAAFMLL